MIEALGSFTVTPRWRAVFSIAAMFAAAIAEADKLRRVREAGGFIEPRNPLGEVMAQSGLHVPTLGEMLAQFLGDTPEAKKAASLIVDNPDPARLLQTLVGGFGPAGGTSSAEKESASAAPSTPPSSPGAGAAPPSTSAPAAPGASPSQPASPPSKFRPDFAPRNAGATTTQPAAETTQVSPAANVADAAPTPRADTSPRFVGVVERRMITILERARARHAALMIRVAECKAELTDLRRRRAAPEGPLSAPVPLIEPESAETTEAARLVAELIADVVEHDDIEVFASTPDNESAEVEGSAEIEEPAAEDSNSEHDVALASEASEIEPAEYTDIDAAEPLPAATAEEALAALEIMETYERQIDELHEASRLAVEDLREDLRQFKTEADAA